MKKFLAIIAMLVMSMPAIAEEQQNDNRIITAPEAEETLIDNKIYFFAHSMCTHCKDAFIYINTYHKDLNIPITDMKFSHNLDLYKQCVKKFDIKNSELRLPLFCMGNHYLMGWEKTSEAAFEDILKKYQTETTSEESNN